jgi:hypothetical protein
MTKTNAPNNDTFRTVDRDFIRNAKGEAVGQYCYQDDDRLFIRRRTHINGDKLLMPQWGEWTEVK